MTKSSPVLGCGTSMRPAYDKSKERIHVEIESRTNLLSDNERLSGSGVRHLRAVGVNRKGGLMFSDMAGYIR